MTSKVHRTRSATLLIPLGVLLITFASSATYAQQATLHGHVIGYSEQGESLGAVGGAKVELLGADGTVIATATSGVTGYYLVPDLRSGTYRYRVTAEGYAAREKKADRSIELRNSDRAHSLDFMLTQGDVEAPDEGHLLIRAWEKTDEGRIPLSGAQIAWHQPGDDVPAVDASGADGQLNVALAPGGWQVSATAEGFASKIHPVQVTIIDGGHAEFDFTFYRDGRPTAKVVEAIVQIQKSDAANGGSGEPAVRFVPVDTSIGAAIDATLTRLSAADLAILTGDEPGASNMDSYVATPASPLPIGDYQATAQLDGYASVSSTSQSVTLERPTYFNLLLLPRQELGKLAGTIGEADSAGTVTPLAGIKVIASNQAKQEQQVALSTTAGGFEFELSPGVWWIEADPSSVAAYESLAAAPVTVERATTVQHDLTFKKKAEPLTEPHATVVIEVRGPSPSAPLVRFVSPANAAAGITDWQSVNAIVRPITIDGTDVDESESEVSEATLPQNGSQWFVAVPPAPLTPGTFHAAASLRDFLPAKSAPKPVAAGQTTFYQLSLDPAPEEVASLAFNVFDAEEEGQRVGNATITFWPETGNNTAERFVTGVEDTEVIDDVSPGVWWVTASADGYFPSDPQPVRLTAGERSTHDFKLKPDVSENGVFALVSVEGETADAPQVQFINADDASVTVAGTVSRDIPIDLQAEFGLDPDAAVVVERTLFLARPSSRLTGRWKVRATLNGFPAPGESASKKVLADSNTYFEVQLSKDAQIVTEPKASLHGYVMGQDEEGNALGPVANATIDLTGEDGTVITTGTTGASGYYLIENLTLGTIGYQVTAEGYGAEPPGRGFELSAQDGVHVLHFVVNKGQDLGDLTVAVWSLDENQEQQRVPSARLQLERNGQPDSFATHKVPDDADFQTVVEPGNWSLSASATGFGTGSVQRIAVNRGDTSRVDIMLPRIVKEVQALVSVKRTEAGQSERPTVEFIGRASDGTHLQWATTLQPIDDDELELLGSSPDPVRDWYWATAEQPLPAGDYYAEGTLAKYDVATSAREAVDPYHSTYFQVHLRPRDELGRLAGQVWKADPSGKRTLLVDAEVVLEHVETKAPREFQTGSQGEYATALEPGKWRGFARYNNLPASPPAWITIERGKDAKQDFVLQEEAAPPEPPTDGEILLVVRVERGEVAGGTPTVRVEDGQGQPIAAQVKPAAAAYLASLNLAPEEQSAWSWFTFSGRVPVGLYRAEASREGYLPTLPTARQSITAGGSAEFYLTLKKAVVPEQIASLVGDVWEEGASGEQRVTGATVELRRLSQRQTVAAANGKYGPKRLDLGPWIAVARADNYFPSDPIPVLIKAGETRQDFTLTPIPPPEPPRPDVYAMVTAELVSTCGEIRAPKVYFVASSGDAIAASVQLISSTNAGHVFIARPLSPLAYDEYQAEATMDHYLPAYQRKHVDRRHDTAFELNMRHREVSTTLTCFVWKEADGVVARLDEIRNAESKFDAIQSSIAQLQRRGRTTDVASQLQQLRGTRDQMIGALKAVRQSTIGDPSRGPHVELWTGGPNPRSITIVSGQPLSVFPGTYWATTWADGYTFGEPVRIDVACGGDVRHDLLLEADPDPSGDGTTIFANVRVAKLEAGQVAVPEVWFMGRLPGGDTPQRIDANVERFASSDTEEWFWAEATALVAPGYFHAEASLTGFGSAQSAGENVARQPVTFQVEMSPQDETLPGLLMVDVVDADYLPIEGARVTARRDPDGQFVSIPGAEGASAFQSRLPAGTWTVSAQADGFETTAYATPISMQNGGSERCEIQLKLAPPPTVEVDALVVVAKMASTPGPSPTLLQAPGGAVPRGAVPRDAVPDKRATAPSQTQALQVRFGGNDDWGNQVDLAGRVTKLAAADIPQDLLFDLPTDKYDFYHAVPEAPMQTGTYQAFATMSGYEPATSLTKYATPLASTTFDLGLLPVRTRINVFVLHAPTETPMSGVNVTIIDHKAPDATRTEITNENGTANVELSGQGTYTVRLTGNGIQPFDEDILVAESTQQFTFNVTRAGMAGFTGVVVDAQSKPIPNAQIILAPLEGQAAVGPPLVSNNTGNFQRAETREGDYRVTIKAPNFRQQTAQLTIRAGMQPVQYMLYPHNGELDNALLLLLTEGWTSPPAADGYYQQALQADPTYCGVDFAMALVLWNRSDLNAAEAKLADAIKKGDRPQWDQAWEAYLWLLMNRAQYDQATSFMQVLAARYYANRVISDGSRQTAQLMGAAFGVLKGPWKSKFDAGKLAQREKDILAALNDSHRRAFIDGRDQVGQLVQGQLQALKVAEGQRTSMAAKKIKDDQKRYLDAKKRFDDQVKTLETQIAKINADIKNKAANVKQLCDATKAEITRYQTGDLKINADKIAVLRKRQDGEKKIRDGFEKTTKEWADKNGIVLTTGREILTLLNEKKSLDTKIKTLTDECKKAELDLGEFTKQETGKRDKIQKDLDDVKGKEPKPPKPVTPPKTPQTNDLEDSLTQFKTYWDYPVEARRQSFIDMLRGELGLPKGLTPR